MDFLSLCGRQKNVFKAVEYLYKNSRRKIAHWFWENHVQIVVENSLALAHKYHTGIDYVFVGALLHDLADVWIERTDVHFETMSQFKTGQILKKAGYNPKEISIVITQVIEPHTCRSGIIPQTMEGKIMATADALAHLQTNFYPPLKKMGLPENILPGNFNEWVINKIERDFCKKIFFKEEQEEVRANYERLKKEFSK
ncbi:MAG: HD domain-containing protein [bacterium]